MGVRRIENDYYDYTADKEVLAVYTTGCGCCSTVIPVTEEMLDALCFHLDKTDKLVFEVFDTLKEKFSGLTWREVSERAKRFEQS